MAFNDELIAAKARASQGDTLFQGKDYVSAAIAYYKAATMLNHNYSGIIIPPEQQYLVLRTQAGWLDGYAQAVIAAQHAFIQFRAPMLAKMPQKSSRTADDWRNRASCYDELGELLSLQAERLTVNEAYNQAIKCIDAIPRGLYTDKDDTNLAKLGEAQDNYYHEIRKLEKPLSVVARDESYHRNRLLYQCRRDSLIRTREYVCRCMKNIVAMDRSDIDKRNLAGYEMKRSESLLRWINVDRTDAALSACDKAIELINTIVNKVDADWQSLARYEQMRAQILHDKAQYDDAYVAFSNAFQALNQVHSLELKRIALLELSKNRREYVCGLRADENWVLAAQVFVQWSHFFQAVSEVFEDGSWHDEMRHSCNMTIGFHRDYSTLTFQETYVIEAILSVLFAVITVLQKNLLATPDCGDDDLLSRVFYRLGQAYAGENIIQARDYYRLALTYSAVDNLSHIRSCIRILATLVQGRDNMACIVAFIPYFEAHIQPITRFTRILAFRMENDFHATVYPILLPLLKLIYNRYNDSYGIAVTPQEKTNLEKIEWAINHIADYLKKADTLRGRVMPVVIARMAMQLEQQEQLIKELQAQVAALESSGEASTLGQQEQLIKELQAQVAALESSRESSMLEQDKQRKITDYFLPPKRKYAEVSEGDAENSNKRAKIHKK